MTAKCINSASRSSTIAARSCLCCRKAFASGGPHERICRACKESEEWLAGVAEFPVASAEAHPTGE
jgi:hypothetical protein